MRSLRDAVTELERLGAVVLGASVDKVETQKDFCTKQKLPFRLLADEKGEVAQRFGVYRPFLRIAQRVTFLIDPQGIIRDVITKVDLRQHGQQVAQRLKELQQAQSEPKKSPQGRK